MGNFVCHEDLTLGSGFGGRPQKLTHAEVYYAIYDNQRLGYYCRIWVYRARRTAIRYGYTDNGDEFMSEYNLEYGLDQVIESVVIPPEGYFNSLDHHFWLDYAINGYVVYVPDFDVRDEIAYREGESEKIEIFLD